jgi:hypothetical protein
MTKSVHNRFVISPESQAVLMPSTTFSVDAIANSLIAAFTYSSPQAFALLYDLNTLFTGCSHTHTAEHTL